MTPDPVAAYVAGLLAGYGARCREEADEWREESAQRVFVSGKFYDRPTAAERRAERESIMMEAHAAGLHGHRPRMCPQCS